MRWLLAVVVLAAAACSAEDDIPWWKKAIFYQVYPRSFKDSNGDGIGDIKGVEQMAPYFKEIGVDAMWLSPFYPSPMADFGYDVSNFTAVDPMFGTMDDFKSLQQTLENLGIKLVIDFVPNHSSDEHPWFQLSCKKVDPYTDFYVWNDGIKDAKGNRHPPNNWMSVFGGSAWQWHAGRQQYYYHDFLTKQPDLNYNNPLLRQKMEEVIHYWLDMGVDGFRLDSANYMFESENIHENEVPLPGTDGTHWKDYYHNLTQNLPKTYQLFEDWGQIFYNYSNRPGGKPRALFLEVYTDLQHTIKYYGKGNTSLMQPFNFELLVHANQSSNAPYIKNIIDSWLNSMPAGTVANWVVGNHDNGRVADRYGYAMIDAINLLTGVLPGIKVTYYGAELGMRDTFIRWEETVDPSGRSLGPYRYSEASRDPQRTPMQWSNTLSAGFSTNKSTWLPVNPNYWWLNVEEQRTAEFSHLKVFQALAKARKDPVLLRGNTTVLTPDNYTMIVVRSFNNSHFALLINMASTVRNFTSQNLFAANNLDIDMEVVITSINVQAHKVGDILKKKQLNIQLRPKAAILLKSYSSASRSLLSLPLLLAVFLKAFWR